MKVPKRWFARRSECAGPERQYLNRLNRVTWQVGVIDTGIQSASELLVDIKFAQYPIAGQVF